jgi:ferrous iron transport protein A
LLPLNFVTVITNDLPTKTILLDELDAAQEATVVAAQTTDETMPADLLRRLSEIGFLPGERVRIVARGGLGGSPLAVRVGTSTFALRRVEARCVRVQPINSSGRA